MLRHGSGPPIACPGPGHGMGCPVRRSDGVMPWQDRGQALARHPPGHDRDRAMPWQDLVPSRDSRGSRGHTRAWTRASHGMTAPTPCQGSGPSTDAPPHAPQGPRACRACARASDSHAGPCRAWGAVFEARPGGMPRWDVRRASQEHGRAAAGRHRRAARPRAGSRMGEGELRPCRRHHGQGLSASFSHCRVQRTRKSCSPAGSSRCASSSRSSARPHMPWAYAS